MVAMAYGLYFLVLLTMELAETSHIISDPEREPDIFDLDESVCDRIMLDRFHGYWNAPYLCQAYYHCFQMAYRSYRRKRSKFELETTTQQYQPEVESQGKKSSTDVKEVLIPNVSDLKLSNLLVTASSDSPVQISTASRPDTTKDLSPGNNDSNTENLMTIITENHVNNITPSTDSDSPSPFKMKILHSESNIQPRNNRRVTDSENSPKSEHKISPSINTFSSVTSEKTTKISASYDSTLNEEINLSNENSTAIDAQDISSSTEEAWDSKSEDSLKNFSTPNTEESSIGTDANETSSSTDFDANSSEHDKTSFTYETKNQTSEDTTTRHFIADNSVSDRIKTSDSMQTGGTASTSYSPKEEKTQPTTNPETIVTKSKLIATTKSGSPTDEVPEALSTTPGFTELKSTKSGYTAEVMPQDHVINIPIIKTTRVIVSIVFIVIALLGAVVIAIYMFRVKRRAVEYDQLLLLR